jgi:tetratricopeptide (TPR) repeat protein
LSTPSENEQSVASVVFFSDNLEVLFLEGSSPYLLITFNEASASANGKEIWGDKLARSAGLNALGFMTRSPNWFPERDMRAAVEAIEPLLSRFPERVLFGHSMGGYGVIKYSQLICATTVLSFCPQFSISPRDVGSFDDRYIKSYEPAIHDDMRITASDVSSSVFLFYDPFLMEDQKNVELIRAAAPDIHYIPMLNTGHGSVVAFRGTALATRLFDLCRAEDFQSVRRFAAERRRLHAERSGLILRHLLPRHPVRAGAVLRSVCADMDPPLAGWFASMIVAEGLKRDDSQLTRSVMERMIEVFPDDAKQIHNFAHLLGQAGKIQEAIAMARRGCFSHPVNLALKVQLAVLLRRNEEMQAARVEGLKVLELDRENVHILRMLAEIDSRDNKTEQAIDWVRRASAAQPDDNGLHVWLANLALRLEDLSEAKSHAEQALQLEPNDVAAMKVLAQIAHRDGDLEKTIAISRRALLTDPKDSQLHSWLAHLLVLSGNLSEAAENANKAVELQPTNIGALRCLVDIAEREARLEDAIRWAREAVSVTINDIASREWAARTLLRLGDVASARDAFLMILAKNPEHQGAIDSLSEIEDCLGKNMAVTPDVSLLDIKFTEEMLDAGAALLVAFNRDRGDPRATVLDIVLAVLTEANRSGITIK